MNRRRCRPVLQCTATGWRLGTAVLVTAGTATCPACDRPVAAHIVRAGVIEVDPHPPADAVICPCGTTHGRWRCPTCGRQLTAAEAVLCRLAIPSGEAS